MGNRSAFQGENAVTGSIFSRAQMNLHLTSSQSGCSIIGTKDWAEIPLTKEVDVTIFVASIRVVPRSILVPFRTGFFYFNQD